MLTDTKRPEFLPCGSRKCDSRIHCVYKHNWIIVLRHITLRAKSPSKWMRLIRCIQGGLASDLEFFSRFTMFMWFLGEFQLSVTRQGSCRRIYSMAQRGKDTGRCGLIRYLTRSFCHKGLVELSSVWEDCFVPSCSGWCVNFLKESLAEVINALSSVGLVVFSFCLILWNIKQRLTALTCFCAMWHSSSEGHRWALFFNVSSKTKMPWLAQGIKIEDKIK